MKIYLLTFLAAIMTSLVSCAAPGEIASLEARLEKNPSDFKAHYELALAYLNRGLRWEVAESVGTPVVVNKGMLKKAFKAFEGAAAIEPLSPEPHYWMKVIYLARGKYAEADKEGELYARLKARTKGRPKE